MKNNNTQDKSNNAYESVRNETDSEKDKGISPLLECFFSFPPKQLALLSSLLALELIENLDLNQQNSIGNFLVSMGSFILAAASQGQVIESKSQMKTVK